MTFTVRALTMNIWNRQGPWAERSAMLRTGFARLAPDVIGLQEVIHGAASSQLQEVSPVTPGTPWHAGFGPAREREDGSFYGNAVLSRFPIRRTEVVSLPCLGVDEPRSLLLAELETPGGLLPVLVTHLSWRFDHGFVREQQVLAIARALDEQVTRGDDVLPALLLGDLNASPDTTEIRFLKGLHALEGRSMYLADCHGETGELPGHTFDGANNPFATPWHERPRRIDYVMVRGPDLQGIGKPLSSEVVLREVEAGIAASDHFGVLATVRMAPA